MKARGLILIMLFSGISVGSSFATDYKVFKDKKVVSSEGLFNVFLSDGDVYFEIPDSLIGRKMIFGVTVISSSDPRESSVGIHPGTLRAVMFQKTDTLMAVCSIRDSYYVPDGDDDIRDAVRLGNRPAILDAFPIISRNLDSTASLCKVTSFFKGDKNYLTPKDIKAYNGMLGYVTRDYDYDDSRSFIKKVSSSSDNVSVDAELSYDITRKLFAMMKISSDEPFSATVRSSFVLPPHCEEAPVDANPKLGIGTTSLLEYSSGEQGSKRRYYATKWPVDGDGGTILSFYVAPDMPEPIEKAIDAAAAIWNGGFSEMGYDHAIQIIRDESVDVDNIHHPSIRYIATPSENIRSSVWCDPETGKIFSADIYIDNDIYKVIQRESMVMTGAWNRGARSMCVPDSVIVCRLASYIAHHMGICLGFTPNLKGSADVPVDSLRSASYTGKYGISNSIMDEIPFNYIVQPGDSKEVKITQDRLGRYDMFALRWLYGNERGMPTPEVYRYGKKEDKPIDPTCLSGDLGNDGFKASKYALANLFYVVGEIDGWIGETDYDYTSRAAILDYLGERYLRCIEPVMANIGGVYYQDEQFGNIKYNFVPRKYQESSLKWVLNQIDSCDKMDIGGVTESVDLNVSLSEYLKKELFAQLLNSVLELPAEDDGDDKLVRDDALEMISLYLWRRVLKGDKADADMMNMQRVFVEKTNSSFIYPVMVRNVEILKDASRKSKNASTRNHYEYLLYSIRKKLDGNGK